MKDAVSHNLVWDKSTFASSEQFGGKCGYTKNRAAVTRARHAAAISIRDDGGEGQAGTGRGHPVLPAIRRYRARYGTRTAAASGP
jgi:hypothetical protein